MERYTKPSRVILRLHPELNEKWVQGIIADDPSVLGLGDLVLRDQERLQPRAGRLDLLLQEPETKRRYEVELQLGATDEAHIIRCIEYWDIERKRYPQYDHCAVLVAEEITSRFLNVVSLFNGAVPLIAIQMQAYRVDDSLTLIFTTVVDELARGLVDDDEDAAAAPTDRAYWEKKATRGTVALADELFSLIKSHDSSLDLKYNKFYIGISKEGAVSNFVSFKPKKNWIDLLVKLPETEEINSKIEAGGLETLDYDSRFGNYEIRLKQQEVRTKADLLRQLMVLAHDRRFG